MIGFTAPWMLLGLLAAAVPILLHLVQRREPPEVAFPAVRYLEDATRDHRRRIKLRHLLLLVLRTLVVVALVLAAAGMTVRGGVGRHAPSALVLVVDNSASSGAVVDGEPLLSALVRSARAVLARASAEDRLWLLTADGDARGGSAAELGTQLDALTVAAGRLDLGVAVSTGRDLIRGSGRRGEVVVVSDIQRSALGAARPGSDVLVLRPTVDAPGNRSVVSLSSSAQPWGADGGWVTFSVAAADSAAIPVTLTIPGRGPRELLVTPGVPVTQRVNGLAPGWSIVTVALPPDELRLDDARSLAVRVAPPPAVHWDADERFVAAAMDVLRADGRVRAGEGVRFGALGSGPSVVMPPSDAAQLGALNRALAARGSVWRYGMPVGTAVESDSGAMLPSGERISRRVRLERQGSGGETLVTVAGEPWLVQGGNVLLLGSRLDTAWTALPLSAAFLPFLDATVGRAAQGALALAQLAPGEALRLPERATAVVEGGASQPVEGGATWRARTTGVYHLTGGGDTLGAVTVSVDRRESDLTRAPDRDVRALWGNATVASLDAGPRRAFSAGSRGDLRGLLLLLALCCALAETGLAGRAGRRN
ncbi:MAG: BatA and WFA domain-containing protein [Gemmatimonadota bacterium]